MRTQAAIEQSVRENLPIIYGKSDLVGRGECLEKYTEALNYLKVLSEPFLRAETLRYQSILLYTSLLLFFVKLFHIKNLSIENIKMEVLVDRKLLVVWMVFIVVIIVVFLVRVKVDERFAGLADSIHGPFEEFIDIAVLEDKKSKIQMYFWHQVLGVMYGASKVHCDVDATVRPSPSRDIHSSITLADLDKFRKDSELMAEIRGHEKYLEELVAEFAEDENSFRDKVKTIVARSEPHNSHDSIEEAYGQYLRHWEDAYGTLALLSLEVEKDNILMSTMSDLRTKMDQSKKIRRDSAMLEKVAPVVFAVCAILLVGYLM